MKSKIKAHELEVNQIMRLLKGDAVIKGIEYREFEPEQKITQRKPPIVVTCDFISGEFSGAKKMPQTFAYYQDVQVISNNHVNIEDSVRGEMLGFLLNHISFELTDISVGVRIYDYNSVAININSNKAEYSTGFTLWIYRTDFKITNLGNIIEGITKDYELDLVEAAGIFAADIKLGPESFVGVTCCDALNNLQRADLRANKNKEHADT